VPNFSPACVWDLELQQMFPVKQISFLGSSSVESLQLLKAPANSRTHVQILTSNVIWPCLAYDTMFWGMNTKGLSFSYFDANQQELDLIITMLDVDFANCILGVVSQLIRANQVNAANRCMCVWLVSVRVWFSGWLRWSAVSFTFIPKFYQHSLGGYSSFLGDVWQRVDAVSSDSVLIAGFRGFAYRHSIPLQSCWGQCRVWRLGERVCEQWPWRRLYSRYDSSAAWTMERLQHPPAHANSLK
jgi:hypothetical protein